MTNYKIQYMPDAVMGGQDFVLCNERDNGVTLYMARSVRRLSDVDNAAVWERAWVAYRQLAEVDEIPRQRERETFTLSRS